LAELTGYRPFILVWRDTHTTQRMSTTGGVSSGTYLVQFEEDIDSADLSDLSASSTDLETEVDGIIDALWDASQVTSGNLPITATTIEDGPTRVDYSAIAEQGDHHAMLVSIDFGD